MHNFVTKAREWLNNMVPRYIGPRLDNWDFWKRDWATAITNSMHPSVDQDGRKLALMEARKGEAAVQAKQIIIGWQDLSPEEMISRLDGIFMPWQESHLARLEFRQYRQLP